VDNTVCDLNGNEKVDICDVAIVAEIFGIEDEYDPAIDYNISHGRWFDFADKVQTLVR
jgi:hypothetical protein